MRTAPGTIWLLAAAMVLTVGVSTGAAAATRCPSGSGCPVDVTKLSLTGVQVGQALLAILAVLPGHGFTPASGFPLESLAHGPVLRAAAGSVLYLALVGLLSLGAAAAVWDSLSRRDA